MEAHILNKNSWHFKLAKKLDVVESRRNWRTDEETGEIFPISVCQYVRGLILKSLLTFALGTIAVALAIGTVVAPFIWGFLGDPMNQTNVFIRVFGFLGTVIWGAGGVFLLGFLIVTGFGWIRDCIKNRRANTPRKPEKTEGFAYMVKSVYKSKICYQLN